MESKHVRPRSFDELFECMRFDKTKGLLRDIAVAMMKAGISSGQNDS